MLRFFALGLFIAQGVFGCTIISDNLLGRLQPNEDSRGEPMFVLDGNQVGTDKFTRRDQELTFSVHSRGQQGMKGVVVKAETQSGCGVILPSADGAEPVPNCPGAISSSGEPKRHYVFGIKAPKCGCVVIRIMVVGMDRHVYGEDANVRNGRLTKTVCLEETAVNRPSVVIEVPIEQKPVEIPYTPHVSSSDEDDSSSSSSSSASSFASSSEEYDPDFVPDYENWVEDEDEALENIAADYQDANDAMDEDYDVAADLDDIEDENIVEDEANLSLTQRDRMCQRYDRIHGHHGGHRGRGRGHHHGRRPGRGHRGGHHRRGRRVYKRAVRGARGQYRVVVVKKIVNRPRPMVPSTEEDVIGHDWRFRRAIIRECCSLPDERFSSCYDTMIAERAARISRNKPKRPLPPQTNQVPVKLVLDDETLATASRPTYSQVSDEPQRETTIYDEDTYDEEADPDYVPTQNEEDEDEDEYDESEVIDSQEVRDLIADQDEELSDDESEGTECANEGRRGRGKCLMRECCSKGKVLGRTHRGRLWRRCVAGSRAMVFRQMINRRKKQKCRAVFRHCCVAAGRKAREVPEKPKVVIEQQTGSKIEDEAETEVDNGVVGPVKRYLEGCCAAGARVEGRRVLSRCRGRASRESPNHNSAFLRRKCHQKFVRCCLVNQTTEVTTPQQSEQTHTEEDDEFDYVE